MGRIRLYNSLKRCKEEFIPIDEGCIRMYACGPTVYNYAHIGNGRMAVVFDMWARLLRHVYPKVVYVSNITDIEDKIIRAAEESGEAISDITTKYARIYNEDMAVLGVVPPDVQPRATECIPEMIGLISSLIERGHAYENDGHVLFHVPSDPGYGVLSGRSRDEQIAGARVEVAPYKKDPADFVLWKPSSDDQPGWESPWGHGRPGWHIECSVMSEKHLGLPFDIHGGGADLKFPHHENEIAQSCCGRGHEGEPESFARYWVHNGFVTINGEKMSKSLGNILLVHDLIKDHRGEVLRLALLSSHYRKPLDWNDQILEQSRKLLDRLYRKMEELEGVEAAEVDVPDAVLDALCDDLNTPQMIAELNALLKSGKDDAVLKGELLATGNLIGILQEDAGEWLRKGKEAADIDVKEVERLIEERKQAKAGKDFARADEIRGRLLEMGVVIEDTREGTKWKPAG